MIPIDVGFMVEIPFRNQRWLAGKSNVNGSFNGNVDHIMGCYRYVPYGKRLHNNYGKTRLVRDKSTICIAMVKYFFVVYQRVSRSIGGCGF